VTRAFFINVLKGPRRIPQGLKPLNSAALFGTTEQFAEKGRMKSEFGKKMDWQGLKPA